MAVMKREDCCAGQVPLFANGLLDRSQVLEYNIKKIQIFEIVLNR